MLVIPLMIQGRVGVSSKKDHICDIFSGPVSPGSMAVIDIHHAVNLKNVMSLRMFTVKVI